MSRRFKKWKAFTGLPAFGGAVGDQGSEFKVQAWKASKGELLQYPLMDIVKPAVGHD